MTTRIGLLAIVLALVGGLGWAGYHGWIILTEVQEQVVAIEQREGAISNAMADLEGQVAALTLEMTDQSLAVTVEGIASHVAELQSDLEVLRSTTDEHSRLIGDMDERVGNHQATLGDITGPFWSPPQDRNLTELNDGQIQVESYIGEIDGQLTNIEAYLVELDDALQRIERCLSSLSEFLPGC